MRGQPGCPSAPRKLRNTSLGVKAGNGECSIEGRHVWGPQAETGLWLAHPTQPAQALSAAETLLAGPKRWPERPGVPGSQG